MTGIITTPALVVKLVHLVNGALQFTEAEQYAVACTIDGKAHKFLIDLNGQEFEVTVKELARDPRERT